MLAFIGLGRCENWATAEPSAVERHAPVEPSSKSKLFMKMTFAWCTIDPNCLVSHLLKVIRGLIHL